MKTKEKKRKARESLSKEEEEEEGTNPADVSIRGAVSFCIDCPHPTGSSEIESGCTRRAT